MRRSTSLQLSPKDPLWAFEHTVSLNPVDREKPILPLQVKNSLTIYKYVVAIFICSQRVTAAEVW